MKEEKYILFDQYLQGELTDEARLDFEKKLSENHELASEFETFKEVQIQLETKFDFAADRDAFEENLKAISKEHFKIDKSKVISFKPWAYLVAASVALLFGLFLLNPSPKPVFEQYNQYENAYLTERSEGVANLKQAEATFNAKNYKEAIPLFEAILKENKTAEIQYFYGVSLLENNQIKQAETVFNEIKSGNSIYKNKAIWSLALAKLKQKDYKGCKEILLTIPSDYENYDKVQELMDKLD
ncbi:tetratricopeptide repeat protein [Flavobacterium sufflavum]|uniref:Tetratricopeptide repeat protein n=1 Tax=Flavobacterium sufflavum TaxID=1921138 RepID=A0A3S2U938_9FLAO|nr:tetratricopeptide repeat protein [Flavobacterium sufflavum]RVT79682.1 tetratricopeptide repeat protein [Flavobacterium sufflavum]